MNGNNYRRIFTSAAAFVTYAAVASAALVGATPALADSSESAAGAPTAAANYNCYGFHLVSPSRWEGGCSVASGEIRTVTYCSDGSNRLGGWIGARTDPWFVYGDCGAYRVLNTGFIIQTRG